MAAAFIKGLPEAIRALPGTPDGSGGAGLVINASALSVFDSSALAVLLECRRQAMAAGQRFSVSGAPARLLQLATLYGVVELFPVTPAGVAP